MSSRLSAAGVIAMACFLLGACDGGQQDEPVSFDNLAMSAPKDDAATSSSAAADEGFNITMRDLTMQDSPEPVLTRGLEIRKILGRTVYTSQGTAAARLDDILFNTDGVPSSALLTEGGILSIGTDPVQVPIQRLVIKLSDDGSTHVVVAMSKAELKKLAGKFSNLPSDFSEYPMLDLSFLSARRLMEVDVQNIEGEKLADVYDILLNPSWAIDRVVLSRTDLGVLKKKRVVISWTLFTLTDDHTALRAKVTLPSLETFPEFASNER